MSPTSPSSSFACAGVASTSALPLAPVVPTSVGAVVGLKRSLFVASVGEGVDDESSTSHPALADAPSVVGKRLKAAAAAARTNKKNKKNLVLLGAKRARNNKNNSNNPAAGSGSASPSRFAFTFGSPTSSDSIDSLSPNIEYSGLGTSPPPSTVIASLSDG